MHVTFLCLILSLAHAAEGLSSITSAFGGKVLLLSSPCQTLNPGAHFSQIEMKKGKSNVPAHMRGQYKRMEELSKMRENMMEAQKPGSDGLPVFNLYVRSPRANLWYPCGSFKGDNRSQALCTNYKDNGWLADISKQQLDSGISGSLWRDQDKLKETIVRAYPQLRETRDKLEFGYKLGFEGLSEEQTKVQLIVPKEPKGILDNIKDKVSDMFSSE